MVDNMQENFRDKLKSQLKESTLIVTFTKKDGTERVMRCTLQPHLLPLVEQTEKSTRKSPENTIAVYDLDNQGWRSFIVNNVTKVEEEVAKYSLEFNL